MLSLQNKIKRSHSKNGKDNNQVTINLHGFTLIEALITVSIFAIVVTTFYSAFSQGLQNLYKSRNRIQVTSVANQEMEIIRSLTYDDIGISGGVPDGILVANETKVVNDDSYEITRSVLYKDHPDDGTVAAGSDMVWNDYKLVRIITVGGTGSNFESVELVSRFAPPGIEVSSGGGVLSINALDFSGTPIGNVAVRIVNVGEGIDVSFSGSDMGTNGNLTVYGLPIDGKNYQITLSATGLKTTTTMPVYPDTAFDPISELVNAQVATSPPINVKAMSMVSATDVELTSVDQFGNFIPSVEFTLAGGRQIGSDHDSGDPVFDYPLATLTTSAGAGTEDLDELSGSTYTTTTNHTDHTFWKIDVAESTDAAIFEVIPEVTSEIQLVLIDDAIDGMLISVTDTNLSGVPLEGAEITIKSTTLNPVYDVTATTDQFGKVYFPQESTEPLIVGEVYDIEVEMDSYDTHTGTIILIGGLQPMPITLDPS